jgi:serine-type D-Ala-D-Ala endopeptidase (penicillin-binding protein 7)
MKSCAFLRTVRLGAALVVVTVLGLPAQPVSAATQSSRPTRPAVRSAASQTSTAATTKQPAKRSYSASASKARQARVAKARAEARAREVRDVQTPRFRINELGQEVPDVRAEAAIIYNPKTNEVLWESNAQDQRSIASITKVMTALVFLEDNPDLSRQITIERSDVYAASTTYLRTNDRISLSDVLHLTLIASDNAAARALARVSHGGIASFVERMNEKAIELGLESTSFADPSGLNPANISSAYDLSRLITFASADERISPIMRTASHTARTARRTITIRNTNHLVREGNVDVLGGKTGFITKAGYCLATLLRLPQSNHQVAVVVLGAGSNNGRFWETRHLFNWLSEKASDIFRKEQEQIQ